MAKIIALSDLHVHPFKSYSQIGPDGLNSRLIDAVDTIRQVYDHAVKVDADLVLCPGDIFHERRHIATSAFNETHDAFRKFKDAEIPLVIIPGNHDQADKEGNQHSAHAFSEFATIIDKPSRNTVFGKSGQLYSILGIPYCEDREYIADLCKQRRAGIRKVRTGEINLLMAHLGVQGAKLGADFVYTNIADCTTEDLRPSNFDFCFLGHYHLHQKIAKNMYYVGAPLQHNWGDRGQTRGFVEYDTDTKKLKQIECVAPKFVEVEDVEGWENEPLSGNYVRLVSDEEYSADRREDTQAKIKSKSFEVITRTEVKDVVARSDLAPGDSYDKIIDKYIASKNTDLDPGVLAQLGRDIMKEVL